MSDVVQIEHLRTTELPRRLPNTASAVSISLPEISRTFSPQSWDAVSSGVLQRITASTAHLPAGPVRLTLVDVPEAAQRVLGVVLTEHLSLLRPDVTHWNLVFGWRDGGGTVERTSSENAPFIQLLPQRLSEAMLRVILLQKGEERFLAHNLTERLQELRAELDACPTPPRKLTFVCYDERGPSVATQSVRELVTAILSAKFEQIDFQTVVPVAMLGMPTQDAKGRTIVDFATTLDAQAFRAFARETLYAPRGSRFFPTDRGFRISIPASHNEFELDYYLALRCGGATGNPVEAWQASRLRRTPEATAEREARLSRRVADYYAQIDVRDIPSIVSMYAANGRYDRAEDSYIGPSRLMYFFENERRIQVRHVIESNIAKGDEVITRGSYDGFNEAGEPIAGRFADFWRFDADDLVTLRQTYLAKGAASVRA